jgi:hypothetical protein
VVVVDTVAVVVVVVVVVKVAVVVVGQMPHSDRHCTLINWPSKSSSVHLVAFGVCGVIKGRE